MRVVGRAENSGERWSFRSQFSLAHDPQRAAEGWDATNRVPDLHPPWKNLQRNENGEEKGERTENRRNSDEAKPYESTSKTPILYHKSPITLYTHQE